MLPRIYDLNNNKVLTYVLKVRPATNVLTEAITERQENATKCLLLI